MANHRRDAVVTEEYRGYTIHIVRDPDPSSPQDEGDEGMLFLVAFHRQFAVRVDGYSQDRFQDPDWVKATKRDYWIYPLDAYIHSGVHLSLQPHGDRWDSGLVGFVLVRKQEWKRRPGKHGADQAAEGLVSSWNAYLEGSVYGYEIEDDDGEQVDSCWGFYPSLNDKMGWEYCLEEARRQADYYADQRIARCVEERKRRRREYCRRHGMFTEEARG